MAKKNKALPTGSKSLAASVIHITNFMGVDDVRFEPGKITMISGKNAAGKSSIIKALKSLVEGGHDATLIRQGREEAGIAIELKNGTLIEKTIMQKRSDVTVDYANVLDSDPPMVLMKKITSSLAVWPLKFIDEPKKRLEWVLESLPATLKDGELEKAIAPIADEVPEYVKNLRPLAAIEKLYDPIYSKRTDLNRSVKEKRSTVAQLFEQLPDQMIDVEDLKEEIELAKEEGSELRDLRDAEITKIDDAAAGKKEELDAIVSDIHEQIRALEISIKEIEARVEKVDTKADLLKMQIRNSSNEQIQAAATKVRELETQLESAGKTNATIDIAQKMVEEVEMLEKAASNHSQALDALKLLKRRLLDEIPIPGVTIDDGELAKGGIPFDNLNRQQQIDIILRFAVMNAGALGLVCLDGFEALDDNSQRLVFDWIKGLDNDEIRFIFTQVSNSALSIETIE